jgi:hypothetical protein
MSTYDEGGGPPPRAASIRLCGQRYATQEEAEQSQAGKEDGATAAACWDQRECKGWHVRPAPSVLVPRGPVLTGPLRRRAIPGGAG